MTGIVGYRDEAEEKEDEIQHTEDADELLIDNLFSACFYRIFHWNLYHP